MNDRKLIVLTAALAAALLTGACSAVGDDAQHASGATTPLPGDAAAAADAGGAESSDDDGAGLARALLGGIVGMVTGTTECAQLAAAAGRSAAPQRTSPDPDSARIPLAAGLRIVYAGSNEERDFEYLVEVPTADERGLDLSYKSRGTLTRRVLWEDVDAARCYAAVFSGDRRIGPGVTWIVISRALLAELRANGEVDFGFANEPVRPRSSEFVTFVGKLRRVESGSYTVVLDDSIVQLPSMLVRAEVRHEASEKQLELEFLDDLASPILLRACCERSADRVVRIERPRERRIERALAETGQAVVYGIYFEFGSSEIGEDSEPVLDEIADALRRHPEWHLRVEGHTDAIGDADSNLELSRRRAEAVRTELIRRLGPEAADRLETAGYGESRPRADNGTLEGRAANRRVELIRSRP